MINPLGQPGQYRSTSMATGSVSTGTICSRALLTLCLCVTFKECSNYFKILLIIFTLTVAFDVTIAKKNDNSLKAYVMFSIFYQQITFHKGMHIFQT